AARVSSEVRRWRTFVASEGRPTRAMRIAGAIGALSRHLHQEYWQSRDDPKPRPSTVGRDPTGSSPGAHAHGARRGLAPAGDERTTPADDALMAVDRTRAGDRIASIRRQRGRPRGRRGPRIRHHATHERGRRDALRARPPDHILDVPAGFV